MDITERIADSTQDDAGCAVWKKACCGGHPAIRHEGKTQLVRRLVWSAQYGPVPEGCIVAMTCETPRCVSLDCIELTTYQRLAKKKGALGLMSGPVRSAAIARAKRKGPQSKLTAEAVRHIRTSNETGVAMAARFGVSQAHVSKVRLHQAQREFSSPWAGL